MGRAPCCDKASKLKKGPWTPEEDALLVNYINSHGPGNWRNLPNNAGLDRCGKSCRLRWTNYLRPDIKRGSFSFQEEETIIQLHRVLGNKWSAIAAKLPGRTDNEIKNYWNTHIRKRLLRMGIDPVTHAPRLDLYDLSSSSLFNSNSLFNLNLSSLLLGNQAPLVNPQLVSVLTTLLSSLKQENPQMIMLNKYLQETQQCINNNTLLQNYQGPPQLIEPNDVNNQFQTSNQEGFCMEILKQLVENSSVKGLLANSNYMTNLSSPMLSQENKTIPLNVPNVDHQDMNPENSYLLMQDLLDDGSFNFESVMSTPLSSPTPSTNVNSSTNLFKFELPETFDISDFM